MQLIVRRLSQGDLRIIANKRYSKVFAVILYGPKIFNDRYLSTEQLELKNNSEKVRQY